ncbi:hypothetical protein SmJEL517_g05801 [Synchytrium microbalum]|uniref:glutathione gamma-glutamylcysteinyltransferase n=1 Tax=Synchytrium microbalum TaxID=1806994 RepID=A0A507BZJ5_9FUNG|nr:uncharacterized protein SmJEL517_g05801 [Synchytrium microbalum]TPX30693.1 hypothetical protein SmJEL517_g05801 [Synchytrium microbalum]
MKRGMNTVAAVATSIHPSAATIPSIPPPPTIETNQSFYRRQLPENLTALTTRKGRRLLQESLIDNHAETYLNLSGNFAHQSEPAYCGLGSLAMVLNSLGVDPGRTWKGPWRWYSESMLECCSPLSRVKETGITFDEFACLASCNGLNVKAYRGGDVSYEQFLFDIERTVRGGSSHSISNSSIGGSNGIPPTNPSAPATSTSTDNSIEMHMIVSFARKSLNQTGDGHFSPIGAFHRSQSQVLVMETATFKYPSYFVNARELFDAMSPVDKVTNKPRGYFLLTLGSPCKEQKLRRREKGVDNVEST